MRRGLHRGVKLAAVLTLAAATAGCGNMRETLGLNKEPPDEFQVVARQPLSVPPEFELRPPRPGASRPQSSTVREQAQQTVFRQNEDANATGGYQGNGAMSEGERSLLTQAGADKAPGDIREVMEQETERLAAADESFVDTLVFWRDSEGTNGSVIDPEKEAKRLRENAALGKDLTAGQTPTIERRERGLFGDLFE
jgi:hypothetical protein